MLPMRWEARKATPMESGWNLTTTARQMVPLMSTLLEERGNGSDRVSSMFEIAINVSKEDDCNQREYFKEESDDGCASDAV